MAIYRRILIHPKGGGGIKQERFMFGGTGFPSLASAATCISVFQNNIVLNIDLVPVVEMLMSPNAIIDETVPICELSGPIPKVDEELS